MYFAARGFPLIQGNGRRGGSSSYVRPEGATVRPGSTSDGRAGASEQAELGRLGGGGGAGGGPQLAEHVGDVAVDGMLADREACGDLPVAQAFCDESQDLQLPAGEA